MAEERGPAAGAPAGAREADAARLRAEALAEIDRVLRGELGLARSAREEEALVDDLQLDSVSVLTLVVGLEDRFRVALREEDAGSVRTVGELAALVAARALEARAGPPADDAPLPAAGEPR